MLLILLYGQVMVTSPRREREAWSGSSGPSWAIGVCVWDARSLAHSLSAVMSCVNGNQARRENEELLSRSNHRGGHGLIPKFWIGKLGR